MCRRGAGGWRSLSHLFLFSFSVVVWMNTLGDEEEDRWRGIWLCIGFGFPASMKRRKGSPVKSNVQELLESVFCFC